MKIFVACVSLLLLSLNVSVSHAGELKYCGPNDPDGMKLETENKRVISVSRVPVKFNDASGRRKARVIAQERAKGEIVRFFQQNQTSIRSVKSTDADNEKASQLIDENGRSTKKSYSREQSDVLVEMETSIASGDLSGILQIEESFDASMEEMCVAMGFSAKSGQAAKDAQSWMKGSSNYSEEHGENSARANQQGSYTRSIDEDW